jgi:hypothetical protein
MRIARAIRVAPLQARQVRAERAASRRTGAARDRRGAPPPARRFQRVPAGPEPSYRPSGVGRLHAFAGLNTKLVRAPLPLLRLDGDGHAASAPSGPTTAELTMIIKWCMGVTDSEAMNQEWQNGRSRSFTEAGQAILDDG